MNTSSRRLADTDLNATRLADLDAQSQATMRRKSAAAEARLAYIIAQGETDAHLADLADLEKRRRQYPSCNRRLSNGARAHAFPPPTRTTIELDAIAHAIGAACADILNREFRTNA
jgi:hypothetical protein